MNYDLPFPSDRICDLTAAEVEDLKNIQANILKSDGRRHLRFLFFHLPAGDATKARRFIAKIADTRVSTMYNQLVDSSEWQKDFDSSRPLVVLGLTASGFAGLGFKVAEQPNDIAFIRGMLNRVDFNTTFGDAMGADGKPRDWERGYRDRDIHGMLLVGHSDPVEADRIARQLGRQCARFGVSVVAREKGEKRDFEPFGFRDGISMPEFFRNVISEANDAARAWKKVFPLKSVLVFNKGQGEAGPLAKFDGGSFAVFRKLEQHVAEFHETVGRIAERYGLSAEIVGAMIVGRHSDGRPLAESVAGAHDSNDFNFSADPNGNRCPFQAHIRKANPRDGNFTGLDVIARRGSVYRKRGRTGLLFLGYTGRIDTGFNQVQGSWINDPNFPRQTGSVGRTGIDALVGQPAPEKLNSEVPMDGLRAFVTPRGGAYLFVPPMSWFRQLAGK